MEIKIRDWFVLLAGVVLALLGGFQIAYNLEAFQTKDYILAGTLFVVYAWLYYQHKYKGCSSLFDEYYSTQFYKTLEIGLAIIVASIFIVILLFKQDGLVSVNYIYGAIRLGMGLWLVYFSFKIMKEVSYE